MTKPVEKITIGGREYTKFIMWPKKVRDGTFRCIRCGQIDEEEYHDPRLCPAGCRPDGRL
jgi:hypothetical protein